MPEGPDSPKFRNYLQERIFYSSFAHRNNAEQGNTTLQECTFHPAFVSERMARQGRALKLAGGALDLYPPPPNGPDSPDSNKYLVSLTPVFAFIQHLLFSRSGSKS